MTPTPIDTLRHCLDQLAYNLPPQERERYVREAEAALFLLQPQRPQPATVATRFAAWRWAVAELGPEPLDVDQLVALCTREQQRPRDLIHKRWADALMRDLSGAE